MACVALEGVGVTLAQLVFLHFAHDVPRQRFHEHDVLGLLVPGQLVCQGGANRLFIHLVRGRRDHHGDHALAQVGMGDTNHRRLQNPGKVIDNGFDFLGINVVTA